MFDWKVFLCVVIAVQAINAASNPMLRDNSQAEELSSSLVDILTGVARLNTKVAPRASVELNTNISSVISEIQTTVDSIFSTVNSTVSSILNTSSSALTTVGTVLVSPLLNLVSALSELTLVQAIEPLYIVILVLETVLTIANGTLANIDTLGDGIISTLGVVQNLVDSTFSLILSFV